MARRLDAYTQGGTNFVFRDKDASPAKGAGMWETAPMLAVLCDPVGFTHYHDDFHSFVAGDWTITETEAGAGDAAEAITDGVGGLLLITCDAADDDSVELQKVGEAWKLASGKACWFEARLKISDATQSDLFVGLNITDTTLIDGTTDGVSFRKADGSTALSFVTEKNSTETTTASIHTVVADTFFRVGFYFDGVSTVYGYVNGLLVATHTTNIPDDEELCVSIAIQNGEAVAKTLTLDYVKVLAVR